MSPTTVRTAWPKMIGSETFIIVAFRCTEKSTPCALASATCAARKASSAARRMTAASSTSPTSTGMRSLSTVTVPSAPTCSIRTAPCASTVTDCPSTEVAVGHRRHVRSRIRGPRAHAVRVRARERLRGRRARRSELPSRSTGSTALPLIASYLARTVSAGFSGSRGSRTPSPEARRSPPSSAAATR